MIHSPAEVMATHKTGDLTCDHLVTYHPPYGRGVQSVGRSDAPAPAGHVVPSRRPDARPARAPPRHDTLRRHEAPARARGRPARRHQMARPGETALPERRANPPDTRPVARQVFRTGRRDAHG